ncbi:DNA double-strand break repair nuclease NurA [Oscillatoria sp. FACHB-1406]|uniref:DNA double-strand break repair nuclease NurA n=1 Tax=Oscillatoria sp. FACHB-1406 TaxID=2692846 RepID=UPI001684F776|nr:DNA double-strand break repair nuclease NurA [Oscillatoria sp. FACHB-1406]MBD2579283.1 DNA double-strand break repair nuclease NurA [Oscillatoria sp. FACHB-1406]
MLDLTKLAGQMPGISQHLKQEVKAGQKRLETAKELLERAKQRQVHLVEAQQKWRDRALFAAATPLEPLDTRINLFAPPERHTVFATDGSQIAPSHHEVAYCYLINVGRVMLHYGQSLLPLLDSLPEVFYKAEDLYVSKQWGIRTEEWMGHRRMVSEAQMLAEMACRWVKPPGAHPGPNLAMVDGSLIYWFLEGLPGEARDRLLPPIIEAWAQLQEARIPWMGYLSAARSGEATNFLRYEACPHPTPDCTTRCNNLERFPCQIVDPLRDTSLWEHLLQPGQRGPLWASSARILELYPEEQRVYFCYVHVGTEIARVEVPQWVIEDEALLNQSLSIMLAQVHKGYGYPVALAESHNQAVVRGGDRARFFSLLEQQMIRAGLRNVGTSHKEARKRGSIA